MQPEREPLGLSAPSPSNPSPTSASVSVARTRSCPASKKGTEERTWKTRPRAGRGGARRWKRAGGRCGRARGASRMKSAGCVRSLDFPSPAFQTKTTRRRRHYYPTSRSPLFFGSRRLAGISLPRFSNPTSASPLQLQPELRGRLHLPPLPALALISHPRLSPPPINTRR
jgi:hypothetical protein